MTHALEIPVTLEIPVLDQRQAHRDRQRRYRDANREKIRAAGRARYHANKTPILAQQAAYHRTEAGRATMKRANDKRCRASQTRQKGSTSKDQLLQQTTVTEKTIQMPTKTKTPKTNGHPGRPGFIKQFCAEHFLTVAEMRAISRHLATIRKAQADLDNLQAVVIARATTKVVKLAEPRDPKEAEKAELRAGLLELQNRFNAARQHASMKE